MSCFKFPKKSCAELDSIISKFWWGRRRDKGRICWKSWKSLTVAKREGGMGFKEFEDFNLALLAKTAWRVLNCGNELWVQVLRGIYFHDSTFLEAKKGNRASWGWTSLLMGRELLERDLLWQVGNGKNIKIWHYRWIPSLMEGKLNTEILQKDERKRRVFDLIVDGRWELSSVVERVTIEEMDAIRQIQLPIMEREDRLVWKGAKDGCYTVKRGYQMARQMRGGGMRREPGTSTQTPRSVWDGFWSLNTLPKVKHFIWRAVVGALPTSDALWRRKCAKDPYCHIYREEVETIEHMLVKCSWVRAVWFGSSISLQVDKMKIERFDR